MAETTVGELWRFAVRTYAQPGVTDACLELQDQRRADVIMLLFCVWAGTTRGRLNEQEFASAAAYSRDWNQKAVRPLRNVRRWLKETGCELANAASDDCLAVRERVKESELAVEKIQLDVLEGLLRPAAAAQTASDQLAFAVANLRDYCRSGGIELDAWVVERLAAIVIAGVSSGDLATIESIFAG